MDRYVVLSAPLLAALRLLEGMCARDGDPLRLKEAAARVINCRTASCGLRRQPFELRPHVRELPDLLLAVEYDPSAKCQLSTNRIRDFRQVDQPGGYVRHWIDSGLRNPPRRDHKSWWLLYGQGNTAKQSLIETVLKPISTNSVYSCSYWATSKKDQHKSHRCSAS